MLGKNNRTYVPHELDLAALRSASSRIIVAVGEEAAHQFSRPSSSRAR